jgi:tetratricopeptide (TPR) repeat protein
VIVDGARELPDEVVLWDAAERRAGELGQLELVAGAYRDVLCAGSVDVTLAELLGRRMIALEGECAVDASVFVDALEKVLDLAPCTRWALDRVKLALGSQGRWDALFGAYDRAIASAGDDETRIDLLREAASAARDLAGDAARAIAYFVTIRAKHPCDTAIASSLERLYERGDKKEELVALLTERASQSDRAERHTFQRRIAALLLELGRVQEACAALASMIDDGVFAEGLTDILERVVRHRGGQRASTRCVRDLVRARMLAAAGSPDTFMHALATIEQDIAADATLARVAYRAVLRAAIATSKRAATDAEFDDALEGAWHATFALRSLFIEGDDCRGAARLLARCARLRFSRERQRALLRDAAVLCAARAEDRERAIRLFTEIFADGSADGAADALKDTFVELLCTSAAAWEAQGARERAIAAYEQGSRLGSEVCFAALARVHATSAEWSKALPALEWLCAHSSDSARATHTLGLADALVALGDSDRARVSLEEVLGSCDAGCAHDVRARLIAIYRGRAMWRPLAETLCEQAEGSADAEARAALFSEAAAVLHDSLGEPAESARLLELAVAAAPQHIGLRPQLAGVLEGLGKWEFVAAVLAEQTELYGARRSKERALVHHRLATALAHVDARNAPEVLEHLKTAAKMHPTHHAILFDLARSALDAGDLDLAEKTYRALLLALRTDKESSPSFSCARIFLDLGAIAVRKGDERRAADLFESGLDAARERAEDIRAFEDAFRGIARYDLVARAVESRVLRRYDGSARAAALRELAEIWSEHLGREPELGIRIRRHAESVMLALELEELPNEGAWAALWSTHAAVGDDAAMVAMVRDHLDARGPAVFGGEKGSRGDEGVRGRWKAWLREAMALCIRLEEYELAARVYGALLDADPDGRDAWEPEPQAAWDLGRALEHAGRVNDAVRVYESLLQARPTDRETVRELAVRLEALGSARLADCIELSMRLDPESAPALATRLVALRDAQGDDAELVRALEIGWAADPTNEVFSGRLVESYRASGSHERILRLLESVIAKRPHDAELLCARARAKAALGDDNGAADDLRAIRGADAGQIDLVVEVLKAILGRATPAAAIAYALLLVDIFVRAGRSEEARRELESVLVRFPQQADALERLASLERDAGAWERAAQVYARLVNVHESSAEVDAAARSRAVLALADTCEGNGHPEHAREALERACAALPDREDLVCRLEHVCDIAGDLGRLSELLVARADKTSTASEKTALLLRAASLSPSNELRIIELARAANPQSIEAALVYANIQMKNERPRDAVAALTDVAARNAGKRSAPIASAYLTLGQAHLALDELAEALDALKAGIAMDMRNGELAMLLGLVALDLGDEKTAERALVAVVTLSSRKEANVDGATALFHLASMAYANGDESKARRWLGKALREAPAHEPSLALLQRIGAADLPSRASTG